MNGPTAFRLLCALGVTTLLFAAPEHKPLTVEYIQSAEARAAVAVPEVTWLRDGRAVIAERGKDAELLDPVTLKRTPFLDRGAALAALRTVLGESAPAALPEPTAYNDAGTRALFTLGGDLYLLELKGLGFRRLTSTSEEERCARFSPDGEKLAYVRGNNLFVYDLSAGQERQLTQDGSATVLNGTLSWVYWEEVFGRQDTGYWWSEDSRSIAYFQTDEAAVGVTQFADFKPWTPTLIQQRYPKVGEKNPSVRVGFVAAAGGATVWAALGAVPHEYVVRATWLPDHRRVAIQTLDRRQTELNLLFVDSRDGAATPVLKETDPGWVNIVDDLHFLGDGRHFLWSSERTGFKHLYLYNLDGTLVKALTRGDWALRASGGLAWVDQSLLAVDPKAGWIYFTALEKSSIEHHLYRVKLDGSGFQRLSQEAGTHHLNFRADGKYYFDSFSSAALMPALRLHRADGKALLTLAEPHPERFQAFDLRFPEFFSIPARDGFKLPAQIVKPRDFDPARKYPVIVYVYGGPSAPQVINVWQRDLLWENLLAENGFLVMRVDNRSATAISKTLENTAAFHLMGATELNDLVDAVRWAKAQPYVDAGRVGLWGWSGGGTYTLAGLTRSTEFKAGIAVAGVTDMRFYDTKFAESAMKTEQDNPTGYAEGSLLKDAKNLHGRLLIVHGSYDDNVHIQNAWAFIDELVKANKPFDLMVYPMRKHGITDTPARVHLYSTMLDFWKRNL